MIDVVEQVRTSLDEADWRVNNYYDVRKQWLTSGLENGVDDIVQYFTCHLCSFSWHFYISLFVLGWDILSQPGEVVRGPNVIIVAS